jgi:hypothetical protein
LTRAVGAYGSVSAIAARGAITASASTAIWRRARTG